MKPPRACDVLIVDDDEDFRPLLLQRLQRSGFAAEAAANAEQALDRAQRRHFDVAVFDMNMPGLSGLELLEKFKVQYPDCEVILLTGQGTIETAVQAMQLGAFNYLLKPFVLSDLEGRFRRRPSAARCTRRTSSCGRCSRAASAPRPGTLSGIRPRCRRSSA